MRILKIVRKVKKCVPDLYILPNRTQTFREQMASAPVAAREMQRSFQQGGTVSDFCGLARRAFTKCRKRGILYSKSAKEGGAPHDRQDPARRVF